MRVHLIIVSFISLSYVRKSPEGLDGVGIGEKARQEVGTDTSVRTGLVLI